MLEPEHIYHWFRVGERITTSGMPTEEQLGDLAALGVEHVINLAPPDHAEALRDEAGSLAALGMGYSNIPVDFERPSEADFAAFCRLMERFRSSTLHVHCAANYRVSAFFYRYRRDVLGVDERAARADLLRLWEPDPIWTDFIARRPRA